MCFPHQVETRRSSIMAMILAWSVKLKVLRCSLYATYISLMAYLHTQGLPSMFVFVMQCVVVGRNLLDCSVKIVLFSVDNQQGGERVCVQFVCCVWECQGFVVSYQQELVFFVQQYFFCYVSRFVGFFFVCSNVGRREI